MTKDGRVKLIDFGSCINAASDKKLTDIRGTPYYSNYPLCLLNILCCLFFILIILTRFLSLLSFDILSGSRGNRDGRGNRGKRYMEYWVYYYRTTYGKSPLFCTYHRERPSIPLLLALFLCLLFSFSQINRY